MRLPQTGQQVQAMSEEDEAAECLQCGWPVRRGEALTAVASNCDDCGQVHVIGVVHLMVCAYDLVVQEPRVRSQQRRAGRLELN